MNRARPRVDSLGVIMGKAALAISTSDVGLTPLPKITESPPWASIPPPFMFAFPDVLKVSDIHSSFNVWTDKENVPNS